MTRVVHVVRSDGFAGVEGFIARLAAEQARAGHQVSVIGGEVSRMRGVLGPTVPHTPDETVLGVVRSLLALPQPPDVLNVHMTAAELAATVAAALRRWGARPAVVATCHFAGRRGSGSRAFAPLVAAVARHRVVAQIAVSRFVAAEVGGESDVVHTGVPNRAMPDGPRDRTVLVVQRLEPEKRTTDALRVFAESGVAHRGWRLQVAGDGVDRGAVVSLAAELGIAASTDLLGRRDDVPTLMARAGILLAPTPREGLGLAVVEAMAAGLPILAAGSGGHLETVGSIPEGQLYNDLTDAAVRLGALADDEGGRAAYGAALWAAQREKFTLARQAAATEAVYRRALEARS